MSLTIYGIMAVAYDLIYGHTGLFSAASIAFYATGAYVAAIVMKRYTDQFVLGALCAFVGAYALGWLIGRISLHLVGDYFIVATLGLHYLVLAVIRNWDSMTGGTEGMLGIPRPTFGDIVLNKNAETLVLSSVVLALTVVVAWKMVGAPYGRLLHAVRDDSSAVAAVGHDPAKIKRDVFALSAGLSGLAGVIYATYVTFIDPTSFIIDPLILIVGMVIIGGSGTIIGPLLGSIIVFLTPELLRALKLSDSTTSAFLQNAIFGALLVVMVALRPQGLLPEPLIERVRGLRGRAEDEGDAPSDPQPAPTDVTAVVESRLRVEGEGIPVAVRNVSKRFGGNVVVDDVSLTLRPGTVTSIIGPNGAGKTTLLSCIAGSVKPDAGVIEVAGHNIAGRPAHERVRHGVTRTFQDARLFGRMTVRENVRIGFPRRHGLRLRSVLTRGRAIKAESHEIDVRTSELIDWITVSHLSEREARELSGGQRMLVSLARTMATGSKVILLDEPTAGVAPTLIPRITAFIRDLAALGHTVCLVEHRMELVEDLSDWVIVMNQGRIALEGTAKEAMASEELQRIYFGDPVSVGT
jgi:branched-chain amino acid transport system permease protein